MGVIIGLVITAICVGFGYLMNPTNTTEYNYSKEELWERPVYWDNWEKVEKRTVKDEWKDNWKPQLKG